MRRLKRPAHTFVRLVEVPHLNIAALIRGEIRESTRQQAAVTSPLTNEEHLVSEQELRVLAAVPSGSWRDARELAEEHALDLGVLDRMVAKGLLLSDDDSELSRTARDRQERYNGTLWNPHGAACHFGTRWRDRSVPSPEEQVQDLRALPQPPPATFYDHPGPLRREGLPVVDECRPFHELLRARRTTRSFDCGEPLPLAELSAVLFHSYGCQGLAPGNAYDALRKNSPSGGGLHPVEVYPLLRDVEGISPGLYHYNVRSHALDLIRETDREEAERLALLFVAGQDYFSTAHAIFVLAVRFFRHNWKYRRHAKSYRAVLMDAAHLSQTFYLVCTERGLGAFFTAAINEANIEEELGLDPLEQGVVGVNGCGIRTDSDPMAFVAEPYSPGQNGEPGAQQPG